MVDCERVPYIVYYRHFAGGFYTTLTVHLLPSVTVLVVFTRRLFSILVKVELGLGRKAADEKMPP